MTLFPYWTGACQLSPFDSHILPRCIRESYVNWQNDILIKLIPQIQTVFQYAWTLEETIGFHDLLWSNFLFYVNMSGIHAYTLWKRLMNFKHHTRKVLYTRISEGYTDYIKQNNWQHAQQNTYLLMSCIKTLRPQDYSRRIVLLVQSYILIFIASSLFSWESGISLAFNVKSVSIRVKI